MPQIITEFIATISLNDSDFGIDTAGLGSGFLYNLQMLHCFVISSTIFEIFFVSKPAFFLLGLTNCY